MRGQGLDPGSSPERLVTVCPFANTSRGVVGAKSYRWVSEDDPAADRRLQGEERDVKEGVEAWTALLARAQRPRAFQGQWHAVGSGSLKFATASLKLEKLRSLIAYIMHVPKRTSYKVWQKLGGIRRSKVDLPARYPKQTPRRRRGHR